MKITPKDKTSNPGQNSSSLSGENAAQSSEYYNELIEFSADAIISIDEMGNIELFNKAAEQLFGYSKEESIGKNIKFLMPENHSSQHDNYLANYRDTGKANILNRWRKVDGLRKDGTTVPIEIGIREFWVGDRRTFTGIVRDLSKIERAQIELESMAATLKGISASQAMIEFEMDGTIITANKKYLATMGYELSDIVGRNHSMFVESDHRDSAEYQQFWNDLRAGEFQAGQFVRSDKTGERVWLQAAYNPILGQDGAPARVVKTAVDITQNKLKEIETEAKSRRQAKELIDMSTPSIAVWNGVFLLPLIGTLDSARMYSCTENALSRLSESNAQILIVDITGVPVMDTMVANHLISMAACIKLMGGHCILTGISPATAVSIVGLGIDLSALNTRGTLQEGLEFAIQLAEKIGISAK